MYFRMDVPVLKFRSLVLKNLVYFVVLLTLVSLINCQNITTENMDNNTVTSLGNHNNSIRDTNPVTSLLQNALSGNLAIFDALNTSKREPTPEDGVTMAPTHLPAINMSQSTWSIRSQHEQAAMKHDSKSVPIVGLPLPLSMFEERPPRNDKSNNEALKGSGSQKALSTGDTNPPNAGIYIPMHKLLRDKRQTRQQPVGAGHQSVLMLLNPSSTPNQTQAAQRVMFLMRQQNNPLYNLTFENSTEVRSPNQRSSPQQTVLTSSRGTVTPSKAAVQSLSNLNLVDLTFPLIARNDKVGRTQNTSATAQVLQTHRHATKGSRHGTQGSRHGTQGSRHGTQGSRHSSQGSGSRSFLSTVQPNNVNATRGVLHNQRRPTQPTRPPILQVTRSQLRPNTRILNLRLQNNRWTPPSNPAPSRGTRQPINRPSVRRPTPRLTFVQPVSGRRLSSTRRRVPTSSITRGRTITQPRSSSTLRQSARSRPSTRARSISRRVTTPRRTVAQRRRRVQPARRRTPSDPFTQRFSAGFQRGSTLLHQPPMDLTSFDGTRRDNIGNIIDTGIARLPQAGGFGNPLALQNNIPFPGVGPGLFGGPGMILGGPGFL